MRPLVIEPATFRLVAQFLNQLRHRVPQSSGETDLKNVKEGNIKTRQALYILRNTYSVLPEVVLLINIKP